MTKQRLPNNEIIRNLRDIWFSKEGKKRNSELAELIDINASALSAYCSSKEMSPPRRCPDWVILKMLELLNMKMTISGNEVLLHNQDEEVA